MDTDGKQWRTVPYLARQYKGSDDLRLYKESDYFNDDIIGTLKDGDVAVMPVRTIDNAEEEILGDDVCRYPTTIYFSACRNQVEQDYGIVYQRHNKGIPMLQICDVKLQHSSMYHVKYGWKLDEVTDEECNLEIDRSDKSEQGKKTVKFRFATNETDKLLSHIVDDYEVKYMLRTDVIRLRLELEIVVSSPHSVLDFNSVHGEVKLEIERNGYPYTVYLLQEQHPINKPKLDHFGYSFRLSIIRNLPRNLHPDMELHVKLKDNNGTLDVDGYHTIFSYNIPVDQEDYFHFKNGYIKINVFRGCCFHDGKGLCTGVCTCEPAEFIGFCSPDEVSYIKNSVQ